MLQDASSGTCGLRGPTRCDEQLSAALSTETVLADTLYCGVYVSAGDIVFIRRKAARIVACAQLGGSRFAFIVHSGRRVQQIGAKSSGWQFHHELSIEDVAGTRPATAWIFENDMYVVLGV